jgi:diguanylate cyclase (GGDEF)-like protein
MRKKIPTSLAGILGIPSETAQERAILQQRFAALKKQFPWVYGIFVANVMALQIAVVPADYQGFNPTLFFLGAIAARLVFWARLGDAHVSTERLSSHLLKSYLVTSVVCATFCAWILHLHFLFSDDRPALVVIFASMTSVGVFYGLSSFPAAARAPIYFVSAPVALALVTSHDTLKTSIGLTLSLLMVLMLRMLEVQDHTFVRLISRRFETENQRVSAVQGERSALEEQARVGVLANTDPLTELSNRRGFLTVLENSMTSSGETALVILDLDGFKPINDTFGHAAGDKLLVDVSTRLRQAAGKAGFAARLGGDEFALLLPVESLEDAMARAGQIVRILAEPYAIDAKKMSISACAGVSFRPAGDPVKDMMREADIALYASKSRGRGVVQTFTAEIQSSIKRKTIIEQTLRQPGLIETIDLAFQPIFNLQSMEIRSFEALARWKHSELGWISPAEFIPITEQISAIEELSEVLLRRAASCALSWPDSVKLSFNLSPIQLSTEASGQRILEIIRELGFPASRLQVEVTETALMADFDVARSNLALLRRAGASVVLDDFGAGYASISYLREINFDAIKLDGSLVTSITEVGPALPLLRGVLALCQAMGRQCIAEHVETPAQLRILQQLGCRYGQGYFLARPVDAATAMELARARVIDLAPYMRKSDGAPLSLNDNVNASGGA